jgi:hypothetical protein
MQWRRRQRCSSCGRTRVACAATDTDLRATAAAGVDPTLADGGTAVAASNDASSLPSDVVVATNAAARVCYAIDYWLNVRCVCPAARHLAPRHPGQDRQLRDHVHLLGDVTRPGWIARHGGNALAGTGYGIHIEQQGKQVGVLFKPVQSTPVY